MRDEAVSSYGLLVSATQALTVYATRVPYSSRQAHREFLPSLDAALVLWFTVSIIRELLTICYDATIASKSIRYSHPPRPAIAMPLRLSPIFLYDVRPPKTLNFPTSIFPTLRPLPHRPFLCQQPVRLASQWGSRRTQYKRFENAKTLSVLWRTSPTFRYSVSAVGLGGGAFYYLNLEQVPISGRRRFNCYSQAREVAMAESQYRRILQEYGQHVLPPSHPHSKLVNKVLGRLIMAAGLEGQKWEVNVINDPKQQNAFVLPGGKVFVFSGILPICAGEDGLAAVLGHEIAHNVAHHAGEQLSRNAYLVPLTLLVTYNFDISGQLAQFLLNLAFELPGSRKMELEADYIGLLMMAQACYNPNAAVELWGRMAEAGKRTPMQILSTHPADKERMTAIQEWLPQAQQKRAESQCGITSGYMDDFTRVFTHQDEGF